MNFGTITAMRPDRSIEAQRLFHLALEYPENERDAFLDSVCSGDTSLRQQVNSLLTAHEETGDFLETPALKLAWNALAEAAPPAPDTSVDALERLRSALSDRYTIERELGRGGMARVYLAQDQKHQREVAIKVLRPEVAMVIGRERFLREIGIAARLNHPHIVPLHDSGEAAGLLYYVMPNVEGKSLRTRLEREGQLPLNDALQITREVADALAGAHSLGIIHRDIKPENILLSTGHAVVTDFGIARAIAAAGSEKVTETGIVIGTPAYMSPEQAAGSEQLDARSDVYSLGCVLYEMLAGQPPFTGMSAQAVLAAQVTAKPPTLVDLRRDTPSPVADAIDRALAKEPVARFQTAAELRDAIALLAGVAAGQRSRPLRVAALYGLAAVAVFGMAYGLTMELGLPNWTISGVALLLVAGLPIMVATGLAERRRAVARATGVRAQAGSRLPGWLTWRRAVAGGGVAFGVLGVGTTAYMAMRLLGIGPLGTLVAAGVLNRRQPLILAEFENRTADSTLGPSITTAFRIDLSESPVVQLLDPTAIAEALRRAERPATTAVDVPLARELAQRENVKAVVRGEIDPVGTGFVLSASVIAAADGHVLTAVRETADNDAGLIRALDRLSRKLRERIGESLTSIRAAPPLAQVTTESLEALRKYSVGLRAEGSGDFESARSLYEEATVIDTSFAMAYRKISSLGASADLRVAAGRRAFAHRDRLPELERDLTAGHYYQSVEFDPVKAIAFYKAALELDSENMIALANVGIELQNLHQFSAAESLFVRGVNLYPGWSWLLSALAELQMLEGRYADAQATLERFARVSPHDPVVLWERIVLADSRHDYAAVRRVVGELRAAFTGSLEQRELTSWMLARLAVAQGRLGEAARYFRDAMAEAEARRLPADYLIIASDFAQVDVDFRARRQARGLLHLAAALARHPLASMRPIDRPYTVLVRLYAHAGSVEEALRLLTEFERVVPAGVRRGTPDRHAAAGEVALAEGQLDSALASYQTWHNEAACGSCGLFEQGLVYDRSHQLDSAVAGYERFIRAPAVIGLCFPCQALENARQLPRAYERLAQLYEARGDRAKAREYDSSFVDLWKDADRELQPAVAEARAALKRLSELP